MTGATAPRSSGTIGERKMIGEFTSKECATQLTQCFEVLPSCGYVVYYGITFTV